MTATDEVKLKTDIVEVVSNYGVKLEKMGRNYRASCPFHAEKHGSFFVFPEQQRWHCFGACATGGDVIAFVMKKEGMDFGQALRLLADRTGVKLTTTNRNEDAARDRLFEINSAAADFFHHQLTTTAAGAKPRSYLGQRGLNEAAISSFQLGYSPDAWDALKSWLVPRGHSEADIIAAGLAVQREGGGSYDRFRNRLMFPIRDAQGRITGFGGRALDDSMPKYLNSPQSAVFDKSSTLYGIDLARTAIKSENRAVIVEGYMDVIMAHQHGFANVVASMGTSLTEKQAHILKKLASRFALALDPDTAGKEASLRGIQVIDNALARGDRPGEQGLPSGGARPSVEMSIVVLPAGKDPDEVIREDPFAWKTLVETALPAMDYILGVAASRVDLRTPQGRKAMVDQTLPAIAGIIEPVKRSVYVQKLAQAVGLREQDLWDLTRKRNRPKASVPETHFTREKEVEEFCLAFLLQNPDLKEQCRDLSVEYFLDTELQQIAGCWLRHVDTASLKEALDPLLHETLSSLLSKRLPETNRSQRVPVLQDCIQTLREYYLRGAEKKKESLFEQAAFSGTDAEIRSVEEQGFTTSQQLGGLFHEPKGKQRLRPQKGA
ncbi:MAG: DNA primase [Chloroflexi bacterium]|nr:DNA primase [Chloroflexota bacterium]